VIYKGKAKVFHDAKFSRKEFQLGEKVLLFNSKLRLFPGKLNTRWLGPFQAVKTYPHGAVEIKSFAINKIFKVLFNGGDLTRGSMSLFASSQRQ